MDWTQKIDGYCERVDLTFWSEPINAVTNAAFIIAALIMARRTRGSGAAQLLCLILFCIGVGSFLFHTFATRWAALADTAPIGLFILAYLYLVNRDLVGWPIWAAALGTLAFAPYAAAVVTIMNEIPFLRISNFYWTVPILLLIYGLIFRQRNPSATRGFFVGAAILTLSIIARSFDEILCADIAIGTHFLWHCLNAVMLGYMIHVYHTHILAGGRAGR